MFFGNSQRYTSIAKQIISDMDSGRYPTPLEGLKLYTKQYNLNTNMQQRVVEEYNVNMFLHKLKNGNHQEDYIMLEPVINETKRLEKEINTMNNESAKKKKITKTASYEEDLFVAHDANNYEYDSLFSGSFEQQTVNGDIDFFGAEELEKQAMEKDELRAQQEVGELFKIASSKIDEGINKYTRDLIKIANISTGAAKTVIYDLVKEGHEDMAEEVLYGCKYKTNEIKNASMYDGIFEQDIPLLKQASPLVKEAGVLKVIKTIFEKPIKGKAKGMVEIAKAHLDGALNEENLKKARLLTMLLPVRRILGENRDTMTLKNDLKNFASDLKGGE